VWLDLNVAYQYFLLLQTRSIKRVRKVHIVGQRDFFCNEVHSRF
jgi:hypothetical protein